MRLHKEFGVNPTIPVCFWCGIEKNEIILLGTAYKDEAPMNMIIDYIPCKACKEKMDLGICLAEATSDLQFTGRWCVVKEESLNKYFSANACQAVLKHRRCLISPEAWNKLGLP